MKKLLTGLVLAVLMFAPAQAANVNISDLSAAASVAGANLFECEQGGVNNRCTATQIAAFVYGLMSGDATASGTGAVTFATVNSNVGSFGSATQCTTVTVNAKGLVTAASQTACTPAVGSITGLGTGVGAWLATPSSANLASALTDETGSGAAVFGTAPTISSLNATTAMTLAFLTGSTQCLQVNTSGTVSGTGSACGSGGGTGANPTATAGPTAVNGSATTFLRSDGAPAVQTATTGQLGLVKPDGTSITISAGVISSVSGGSGTVTSVATACGATGGTITATGTIKAAVTASSQTGTNYAFQDSDCGKLVNLSNASNQVPTLSAAGSGSLLFSAGGFVQVCNQGAGTQTLTPTTSTIGGASTFVLPAATALNPVCVGVVSDGTNYQVVPDYAVNAAYLTAGTLAAGRMPALTGDCTTSAGAVATTCTKTSGTAFGALATVTPGANVATAAAVALSGAGGLTSTIASGTSAMGTGAIASATCATVVTTTATNTATTDVVLASFNGDPTAVTGYIPAVAGMLTIIAYPTSGNVNFKVCNNTSSSVIPGAITLNWRVLR